MTRKARSGPDPRARRHIAGLRAAGLRAGALRLAALLVPATALAGLAPRDASACAPAPPLGAWVQVASETAIIVWDETNRRQHFIRRASFRGTARDFGFLVPSPTRPELAAVDDGVFDALAWTTRPSVETRHVTEGAELVSCAGMFLRSSADTASAPATAPVRVLEETRVAGHDAAVLEADDPAALATWLKDHGYADGPTLAAWLNPYVEKRWVVTAFKVAAPRSDATGASAAPGPGAALGTEAVRMTFTTDRPFFPYREPEDQRTPPPPGAPIGDGARELLLYVVAAQRVTATVGESGAFPGSTPFARRGSLPAALVPLAAGIATPWLTVMVDPSSPRPGTDELFLRPSAEQVEVEPPPVVRVVTDHVPIPVEPVLATAVIVAVVLARRSRRRPG